MQRWQIPPRVQKTLVMVELMSSDLGHNAGRAFLHRQSGDQTAGIDLGVEAHGGCGREIGIAPAGADLPVVFMGEAAPADEDSILCSVSETTSADCSGLFVDRLALPRQTRGVVITRVEPMSSSFDAEVQRDSVLLEINRHPVESAADYRRMARLARPGDILTLYVYVPEIEQRKLVTVRVDDR